MIIWLVGLWIDVYKLALMLMRALYIHYSSSALIFTWDFLHFSYTTRSWQNPLIAESINAFIFTLEIKSVCVAEGHCTPHPEVIMRLDGT